MLLFIITAASFAASDGVKRVLSLVDYIGGDYKNAVSKGEIISEAEYTEMMEFSSAIVSLYTDVKASEGDKAGIDADLAKLRKKIENKAPVEDVEAIAKGIKDRIISTYQIATYPQSRPSLQTGKELYEKNCSTCHGMSGAGDGPIAKTLDPPPSNFIDEDFASGLSPFKVFNTMSFGIEGTAMPSFPQVSEEDKWNTAFYVSSIRFTQKDADEGKEIYKNATGISKDITDFKNLATISDQEIVAQVTPYLNGQDPSKVVAFLRKGTVGAQAPANQDPLVLTSSLLKESMDLYRNGNQQDSYSKALDAYLEGFEQVEAKLIFKDSVLMREIETKFSDLRVAIKNNKDVGDVEAIYKEINVGLDRAAMVLQDNKPAGKTLTFLNSFTIIVREGLEAALIVAAIIAFLSTTGARETIKYIHLGWITALAAGFVTWILAMTIISISGAQREIIEGGTSLIAAVVLFFVSYWLITKIEVKRWKDYIKDKVEQALSKKSVLALVSVSFFAVYREAFETVLFYQALWIQSADSKDAVIWGLVAGTIVLLGLVILVFKLGMRVPLKYFFTVTSAFLYLLCFILLGKGIREFQEAGIVGITPIHIVPQIDLLGIYPTMETFIPQAMLLVALGFAIIWLGYIKRAPQKEAGVSIARISEDMKSMQGALDYVKGHILEWKKCKELNLEPREIDSRIQEVIKRVNDAENNLDEFFNLISKSKTSKS